MSYLVWEHHSSALGALGAALEWLLSRFIAVQQLPGFWLVVAFAAGLAVNRWLPQLRKKLAGMRSPEPQVVEWLSPTEAAARFLKKDLVANDRLAQDRVAQLKQKIPDVGKDQSATLAELQKELEEAEYLAKHRRTDVIDTLLVTLKIGLLIGKGYPMKRKKGVWATDEAMVPIPANFWNVTFERTDILNLETAEAVGYLGVYRGVMIGRNKDYKDDPAKIKSGPVISHPY